VPEAPLPSQEQVITDLRDRVNHERRRAENAEAVLHDLHASNKRLNENLDRTNAELISARFMARNNERKCVDMSTELNQLRDRLATTVALSAKTLGFTIPDLHNLKKACDHAMADRRIDPETLRAIEATLGKIHTMLAKEST